VSFLVESGEAWRELRAVHVSGRAEVIDDHDRDSVDVLIGEPSRPTGRALRHPRQARRAPTLGSV